MTTTYVLCSGVVAPNPQWWVITMPTTRDKAIEAMENLAVQSPERYGPHGNRRLKVVPK